MINHVLWGCRFLIAALFIVSGGEKLLGAPENFYYVLQAYAVFPDPLARLLSLVFPWIELGAGVFLAMGLWLRPVLFVLAGISGSFILVVGQAIVRRLPIDNCGCFGDLVHLPLRGVIILDVTTFLVVAACFKYSEAISLFSIDDHYKKHQP